MGKNDCKLLKLARKDKTAYAVSRAISTEPTVSVQDVVCVGILQGEGPQNTPPPTYST